MNRELLGLLEFCGVELEIGEEVESIKECGWFKIVEQGLKELRELREETKKKKNEAEALPNRDSDHPLHCFLVLCSSCDHRLVFILED